MDRMLVHPSLVCGLHVALDSDNNSTDHMLYLQYDPATASVVALTDGVACTLAAFSPVTYACELHMALLAKDVAKTADLIGVRGRAHASLQDIASCEFDHLTVFVPPQVAVEDVFA
jgi:hypothetical protein